ncbi:MAG: endonuclease III domain-containing protein [Acidobacteriota bacterium]
MNPSARALAARTLKIIRALEAAHGRPRPGRRKDPLSELIFTILSQNTSDRNRDKAWASLRRVFSSWEQVAKARRERLERAIRIGGLAPTKSKVIQQVLRQVHRDQASYSLDSLKGMAPDEVERYLRRFKGVGLKTIRCVQMFSLGQPAFPVDTHIFRITRRLGLVPEKATPQKAHEIMGSLTPASEVLPFHINLITHGRRVCKAARPLCDACVLRRLCDFGRRGRARGSGS